MGIEHHNKRRPASSQDTGDRNKAHIQQGYSNHRAAGTGGAAGGGHRHKGKYSEVKRFENWKFTQEKRKELREIDRHKKSAALRKYAKLCIKEGIVSDRVNLDKGVIRKNASSLGDGLVDDQNDKQKKKKGRSVPAPFETALKIADERKAEKLRIELEKQKKEKDIKRAEKTRTMKRNDHMKRTKSGQPIMNNQIKNILEKLQSRLK